MQRAEKISSFGLFAALTLCSVFTCMMYSPYTAGNTDLSSLAAAELIFAAAAAPGVILFARDGVHGRESVRPEKSPLTAAVCSIGMIAAAGSVLTEFALFLSSFTHLSLRFAGYVAALLAISLFTARRGIAAVCRCAVILFIIAAILDSSGLIVLSMRSSASRLTLPQAAQIRASFSPVLIQLAAFTAFAAYPERLTLRPKLPLLAWAAIAPVFSALLSLAALAILGDYSKYVRFPFFTASQSVGVGAFQRLDLMFLCARVIGIFMLLSVILCSLHRIGADYFTARSSNIFSAISAAALGIIVYAAMESRRFRDIILDNKFIAAAAIIPVIVLYFHNIAAMIRSSLNVHKTTRRSSEYRDGGVYSARKKPRSAFSFLRRIKPGSVLKMMILCAAVMLLTGCDKVQLQDRMIIKGVGIDEKNGEYLVTLQYLDNYSDGDKQENKVISVSGTSVSAAIGALRDSTGSEPFFGQTSAIIIGEKTAQKELSNLLDYFVRYSESRPTVRLYLSDTTALDILSFKQDGKIVPIDHLTSISPSGVFSDDQFSLLSLYNQLSSKTECPTAAVLTINADAVRLASAACIEGGEVDLMNADEYLTYCLLSSLQSESVVTVGDISCEVAKCATKKTAAYKDGRLIFRAVCEPQLSVLENPGGVSSEKIAAAFSSYLTELMTKSAASVINDKRFDIFGFGGKLSRGELEQFGDKSDYEEALNDAELGIEVRCKVTEAKALY